MIPKDLATYYDDIYRKQGIVRPYSEKLTQQFFTKLFQYFKIPPAARILDVGCGTAFHHMVLHKLGYQVIGIDVSNVGVTLGKKQFPQLSLTVGDAYHLPFKEKMFDVVFLYGCSLLNVESQEGVESFFRILLQYVAPHGMLVNIQHSDLSGKPDPSTRRFNPTVEEYCRYSIDSEQSAKVLVTHFVAVARWGRFAFQPLFGRLVRFIPIKHQWMLIYSVRRKNNA